MIKTYKELRKTIDIEYQNYYDYRFHSSLNSKMALVIGRTERLICEWQKWSRYFDYYSYRVSLGAILPKILRRYCEYRKQRLALKLGLEIDTQNVGEGLMIYHSNNVVNGNSVIGRNLKLHGNNCIGNSGSTSSACPNIGDNVTLGYGAIVIGDVTIADNIKIAAGAVVVHSFLEPGITIAGVPAKKVEKRNS